MSLLARYVGATCRFSRGIVLPRWTGLETVGWPCDPDVRDIMSSGKLQDQARASLTFRRVKHPAASSRWQSYDRAPVGRGIAFAIRGATAASALRSVWAQTRI